MPFAGPEKETKPAGTEKDEGGRMFLSRMGTTRIILTDQNTQNQRSHLCFRERKKIIIMEVQVVT